MGVWNSAYIGYSSDASFMGWWILPDELLQLPVAFDAELFEIFIMSW